MAELRIAIVGAGFSGTLTAVQLLRRATRPIEVVLIDSRDRAGRGVAYGTTCVRHLLNVPAGRMSGLVEEPGHFLEWARRRDPAIDAHSFVARPVYGEYLGELLDAAEREARGGVRLSRVRDRVLGIEVGAGVSLRLASGGAASADRAALALGNFPPADVWAAREVRGNRRYVSDPWSRDALAGLAPDEPVLLIGTGLTSVDMVAQLEAMGHRGVITAVSRHGLLSAVHADVGAAGADVGVRAGASVRAVVRRVRAASRTQPWRSVVDGLRGVTQELWQGWNEDERRRFVGHVRSYWEVHRHRTAPEVGELVARLVGAGRVKIVAGSLLEIRPDGESLAVRVGIRGGGDSRTFVVGRVVNCTGPSCDYRRIDDPLVLSLVGGGLVRPDALRIGLETAADGALIGSDGQASTRLFTLGPPCKPRYWETTAVPEIRGQAAALAEHMLAMRPD